MKVPKKFNIGGVEWAVVIDNEKMDDVNCFGLCDFNLKTIYLADKHARKKLSVNAMEQTFIHEVTHAILDTMQFWDLSKDEKFVNTFSVLLHQILK